ncbi:(5-formylfuran-3-yl)methyl phosphate synthase [Candidatus Nitrosacidococcus tergens]|uniref:(5-formylfuran-3-yl)methyl phosphate synthase n=1 Tax=Candidatus Nitrosacidococcus tergens TaxID=553981 RepID=A0A7G1Q6W8_9GAMM|nr:(5-formylfuran-3-yl)methyl phosphate synthase [Candidatus Nitrosacidococcus tergens]CAB1274102.1 conserved protein of unknown function [Candidatus Nitrosacidococcus tergens]
MNGWLASVSNLDEVKQLLNDSLIPDILDLKESEPDKDIFGVLPIKVIQQTVRLMHKHCQISATIGNISIDFSQICNIAREVVATKVDYLKIGLLLNNITPSAFQSLQLLASQNTSLIGVLFADNLFSFSWIPTLKKNGFKGVMLDTLSKNRSGLLSYLSLKQIKYFIDVSHSNGLIVGLAGSLRIEDIPSLLPLQADYLGFRGALCTNQDRKESLNLIAARSIKEKLNS